MLVIDGSHGEGGGQILRSALALALATGTAFRIEKIRAGRGKPGLLRQHLTSVEAARVIGEAEVEGAALGSRMLTFVPGEVKPGKYKFDIGSAGSTLLVIQALLPAVLVGEGWFEVVVTGGTHNPMAPTYDYVARVLAPLLRTLGAKVELVMARPGFFPEGGGKVRLMVEGLGGRGRLGRLELRERGEVRGRDVVTLRNTVSVEIAAEHVTEMFSVVGERGEPVEQVAERAEADAARWLEAGVPVGEHLADQLLVPLALGQGGGFRTVAPTLHTTTQVDLLKWFLGIEVRVEEVGGGVWELEVPGRAT